MSQALTSEKVDDSAVKYCEDCAFYRPTDPPDAVWDRCTRHALIDVNAPRFRVRRDAIEKAAIRFCENERGSTNTDSCGSSARFFKPRTVSVDDGVRG